MSGKKRKIGLLWLAVILGAAVFGGLFIFWNKTEPDSITRALAARQCALAFAGREEIESTERTNFSEEDADSWYVPYAEYLYRQGLWNTELIPADSKTMGGALTGSELLAMAQWLKPETPFALSEGKKEGQAAGKEDWDRFFELLLQTCGTQDAVTEKELVIVGTPNCLSEAKAWEAYTTDGIYHFEGLSLDALVDRRIRVRVRDAEILEVKEIVSDQVTYENVWLRHYESGVVQAYVYGAWREFRAGSQEQSLEGVLADLSLSGGSLTQIALKKDTIRGKLQAVGENALEVEGYGTVPLADSFRVYEVYGEFREGTKESLTVGYDQAEYVVADGKICAALIGQNVQAEAIRVLLTDASVGSVFHETAVFTSDQAFTVSSQDGVISERHEAGEMVQIDRGSGYFSNGRLRIVPDGEGKIGFTSFQRKYGDPWYEGEIELAETEEGILIINEVDLETYLVYVVPSEMPESYGLEALKAQAVCARSYACRQIEGGAYASYGAHVDDTTNFQVYNNTQTDDLTRQAVRETSGQVLTYNGALVTTYYYATSCGYGNDMGVWGSSASDYPYLKSIHMSEGEAPDLSSEESFRAFLAERDASNLESGSPWYRWETVISAEKMTQRMDRFLSGYAKSHREQVLFLRDDGSFETAEDGSGPDTIGTVTGLEVLERSRSGYVNTLQIEGTEGTVRIRRPGTVRALLGDTELVYTRQDGSTSTGRTILPSASIVLDAVTEGEAGGWKITGGGYGHGVGMSQTAASALAGRGNSYAEILQYFYPGTELASGY